MKTKIFEDFPMMKIRLNSAVYALGTVLDGYGGEINYDGTFYLVETDNTNNYGFHIGGRPSLSIDRGPLNVMPDGATGHARTLKKIEIQNGEAIVTDHSETLIDYEGL